MLKILILLLIPFSLQAKVFTTEEWINLYLRDCQPEYTACKQILEESLGKMVDYSDLVFKHLDKEGLPKSLAIIPIIESSYNENAVSKAGALGLWQIMPYNIESYKTKKIVFLNNSVEFTPTTEKIKKYGFDPKISTEIAAVHFSKLFLIYRDHKEFEKYSVMAYNAGASTVNSWINGKSNLPEETINYYNQYIAVKHIINNMEMLGVKPVRSNTFIGKVLYILGKI